MKETVATALDNEAAELGNVVSELNKTSSKYVLPRVTPDMRMRRLRSKAPLRAMVRETHLRLEQLIYHSLLSKAKV